jgi:hypothetical protein
MWLTVVLFDRSSLQSKARRFLEKSANPPSSESPLKIPRHLIQLLVVGNLIANRAERFIAALEY